VVVCLSTALSVSLYRWVTEDPWQYLYTVWAGALLGAGLFVLHVLAPITKEPLARSKQLVVAMVLPLALVVWALISAGWTVSPAHTPLQAMLLVLVTLTAVWFGYALTFRQQVWSLFVGVHLLTVVSLLSALAVESARFPRDGSWMGVFGNPNTTGPVATLGVVAAVGTMRSTAGRRWRIAIGACVAVDVVVAVMSSSFTAWLALGAAVVAMVASGFIGRRPAARRVRVAATVVVVTAVVTTPWWVEAVPRLLSESSTLNGRTLIWDFVRDSVSDRWLQGFGWASFWDDPANRAPFLDRIARTRPEWSDDLAGLNTAHSTFMEALLFLGAVGLVLVLLVVAVSLGTTWWEALGSTEAPMGWWAGVGSFALVENAFESMIAVNPLFWVLLVAPGFAALRHAQSRHADDGGPIPPTTAGPHSRRGAPAAGR
jgi:O-antigen ligase